MAATLEPLIRDLVVWCARREPTYAEMLDAWRTSCPRLTVWEEAVARGLVETQPSPRGLVVTVTPAGFAHVAAAWAMSLAPLAAPAAALAR